MSTYCMSFWPSLLEKFISCPICSQLLTILQIPSIFARPNWFKRSNSSGIIWHHEVSDRPWLWWMVFDTTGIFTAQPFHDPRKNHWNQTLHSKRHKDASPVSWGKANIIQDILWPSLGLTVKWYFPFAFLNGGDSQWWRQGMKGCWQITLFPAVHLWFGGWIHPDLNGPFSSGGSFNGINYLRAPQLHELLQLFSMRTFCWWFVD